jgi:two-component system response regulator HydG
LFESELFGHVKGAFTDAKEDRAGRFEEAHGGTLFLDEIGNLSLQMQAKLLTVLQNRTVTRVGSNKPRTVDVRIICATNQPIGQMVAERTFRQDLLYRINTIELRLPPLRERPEDIIPLAELFLKQYRHQYKRVVTTFSAALVKQLQRYNWPGNVRELRSAVERAVILTQQSTLQPEDFFQNAFTETSQFTETYQLEEMEKQLIVKAMKKYNGNITEVARKNWGFHGRRFIGAWKNTSYEAFFNWSFVARRVAGDLCRCGGLFWRKTTMDHGQSVGAIEWHCYFAVVSLCDQCQSQTGPIF